MTIPEIKKELEARGIACPRYYNKNDLLLLLKGSETVEGSEEKVIGDKIIPIKPLPKYDGKQITKVLAAGHTFTHYRCEALDGVTKVVTMIPRKIIDN